MNTNHETETLTLTIPMWKVGLLDERLASIAKKAKKYGLKEPTYTVVRTFTQKVEQIVIDCGVETVNIIDETFVEVNVHATVVRVQGEYRFIAKIEHEYIDDLCRNIILGGDPDTDTRLASYRAAKSNCDHCKHDRKRNTTYVVHDLVNDEYMQIGSTCLKDFFGIKPEQALASLEWLDNIIKIPSEEYGEGRSGSRYCSVSSFVNHAVACITKWGFTKASDQDEYSGKLSTATLIALNMNPPYKASQEDLAPINVETTKMANLVLDSFKQLGEQVKNNDEFRNMNEFQYKIGVVASLGIVKPNMWNILAGAVGATMGRFDREAQRERDKVAVSSFEPNRDPKAPTGWHPEPVRSKIEEEVVIDMTRVFDGFYGTSQMVKMHVKNTNITLVWFNTGKMIDEPKGGVPMTATVRGTIKEHKNDKYGKQTILTRCGVVNVVHHK